ncbi:PhnE/PtxC family ABC transporter permease [Leptolyngbya sp. O-77]|uniref:PhnE/PtxC family ABC transporter permease n=1 Tax=Leptolyngbya sp. O-77 TaxID=1080068 RepID=UPI00074D357C|nr:ABC transporter permease subunit [Leptolyngbya sp. O-77]BAU40780.1 Phosphate-import permease protein PhnE [Leptolyngbya sp. O-77]
MPAAPIALPPPPPWLNRRSGWGLVMLGAIALSLYATGIGRPDATLVNPGGWGQFAEFWASSLRPDLSRDFLGVIARATLVTFAYAVCGTTLSVGLGLVGGVLSSQTWWQTMLPRAAAGGAWAAPAWLLIRGLLAVPRAIHELLWGLFFLNILGLNPLVAVLAIALPFGAIVSKVFAEIFDETPQEPLNALLGSGVSPLAAWLYGLLPQAFPDLLSYTTYRFECSLRSAAVLGVIGAGGLGYEILLSLQSLRYGQLWTGFYALVLLNGGVDWWSGWVRRRLGFTSRLDLNLAQTRFQSSQNSQAAKPDPHTANPWPLRLSWGAIALSIPLCFWGLGIDWTRLWSARTRRLLGDIAAAAVPPWPSPDEWATLLHLSGLTLVMSILAIALAGLGGVLLSFPAAQTFLLPGGWLRPLDDPATTQAPLAWLLLLATRLGLLLSRAVPAPIWALVCLFVLFPGILPGAIALGLHNLGILGRLMAEVNENLDDRPVRSLHALGASGGQAILYGVLPQNLGRFLAYTLYRWEVCMRETVIVGLVGAGGLGRRLTEQLSSFDYGGLLLTLGCFVALTFLVDLVSQQMRAVVGGRVDG